MERTEEPAAPLWQRDPDIAFYLALYWSAAQYSCHHNEPVAST